MKRNVGMAKVLWVVAVVGLYAGLNPGGGGSTSNVKPLLGLIGLLAAVMLGLLVLSGDRRE